MAMKHLLTTLARRRPHRPPAALTAAVRSQSTSPAVATSSSSPSLPSPPPRTAMVYDRLAKEGKSKIKRPEVPQLRVAPPESHGPQPHQHPCLRVQFRLRLQQITILGSISEWMNQKGICIFLPVEHAVQLDLIGKVSEMGFSTLPSAICSTVAITFVLSSMRRIHSIYCLNPTML